ncbi:MAG: bifunctional transaldolase/phosoglucose isomerase [Anaerolineaceae bacterium]|nr:bifunctional transaldolase/phosoglucose isomerase [Anaerolineaceae bacterium]
MKTNPLFTLESYGQSIWMDFLRREIISSGELQRLIQEDGITGVTSNPSIFEKAIAGSHDYDDAITSLTLAGKSVDEIYQALTIEDIQNTADLFRPVYDRLEGRDGYVSLEVSPNLAHNTAGTIEQARILWKNVNRPNLMVKVPGTPQGIPAIQQLLGEGINVNITLLFGLPRYQQVIEAYLSGLETLLSTGKSLEKIASVASFFLSRIDVLIDPNLEKQMQSAGAQAELAGKLHGQVAIASAKMAYQINKEVFTGRRFERLAQKGARLQRLLWASTSTKNPAYLDVKYVETLIGPHTINTLPLETINAYIDHGQPHKDTLENDLTSARQVLDDLPKIGINLDSVTQQLEDEGVEKFNKAFEQLMDSLQNKRQAAMKEPVDRQVFEAGDLMPQVETRLTEWDKDQFNARLWQKDASLWKSDAKDQQVIRNSLGWLHVAEKMEENLPDLLAFVRDAKEAGFQQVVHMGMGGSSLAPLVFARTFSTLNQGIPLTVLDTTDPATIISIERSIPLEKTLFIVASKSGTTAEPYAFGEYFYNRIKAKKGDRAGQNFVAITDPGSDLAKLAEQRKYRRIFLNFSDIGGRYSALSYFGLVPAALMGLNVAELLARALRMVHANAPYLNAKDSPGISLGAFIGEMAHSQRDKLTFIMPEAIGTLGMWLEQLVAESTGKEGMGILPVAGEPLGDLSVYGPDRQFAYLNLNGHEDAEIKKKISDLQFAGYPLVTIQLDDLMDIGQEFFRWELATAAAGSILGINAFDQPNVQESKDNTNRLLGLVRQQGQLPEESPDLLEAPLSFYGPDVGGDMADTFKKVFGSLKPSEYIAIMAYLTEEPASGQVLQTIRTRMRDALHLATTLGYGPRFLHSTGQFHKGGPNTGLYLQITAADPEDVQIPGEPYSFSVFKQAQAMGDLEALRKHERRVIRIDLGKNIAEGLAVLDEVIKSALTSLE